MRILLKTKDVRTGMKEVEVEVEEGVKAPGSNVPTDKKFVRENHCI